MHPDLLEHALVRDSTSELCAAALEGILEAAAQLPADFAAQCRARPGWLWAFLSRVDATGAF
jgi:hypothetical protein